MLKLSLTATGLFEKSNFDAWTRQKQAAIHQAVAAGMQSGGKVVADTVRTRMKNVIKDVRVAIQQQDSEAAKTALVKATSVMDKAATKGVVHWKNAARKISRLAKAVATVTTV